LLISTVGIKFYQAKSKHHRAWSSHSQWLLLTACASCPAADQKATMSLRKS